MMRRTILVSLGLALGHSAAHAQDSLVVLSLDRALTLARGQNSAITIARLQVEAAAEEKSSVESSYFPVLSTTVNYGVYNNPQQIVIPGGAFGEIDNIPIPRDSVAIAQGGERPFWLAVTLAQPLTQLFKVGEGEAAAAAGVATAEARARAVSNDVAVLVLEAYAALAVAATQRAAAELNLRAATERQTEADAAVAAGEALEVVALEARTGVLAAEQDLLEAQNAEDDAAIDLAILLGLPPRTRFDLVEPEGVERDETPEQVYRSGAMQSNPDLAAAEARSEEAHRVLSATKLDYVPDVTLFGTYIHQNQTAFYTQNLFNVGIRLSWTVFEFGKRANTVGEKRAVAAEADAHLRSVRSRVEGDVEKSVRKLDRSWLSIEVAREALATREQTARIKADQAAAGTIEISEATEAAAAALEAAANLQMAEYAYRVARAQLERVVGTVDY